MKPLTHDSFRDYHERNAATTAGGFGDPDYKADDRRTCAVFLRPSHGKLNGRAVREAREGLPVPCSRFANPHGSAHPVWRREADSEIRYKESVMDKSTRRSRANPAQENPSFSDPGMADVLRRQLAASSCFAVGDRVLYFPDGAEYGQECTVAEGYSLYAVSTADQRIDYRYGYAIQRRGSNQRFFVPAYQLTRDDCKPSHLRLVE